MIDVRDERIEESVFLQMHEKEISAWPTGKDIDLDEAVEYQKSLPDDKNFAKRLARYKEEGRTGLYPRSGVPVVEDEIALLKALNSVGVELFPFTTDSYTRNRQFEKARLGLEESIRTGKNKLNGYPIINHGVKTNRRVVESCRGAFDPRSSYGANSFVAEMAFASGMTSMPNSFFGWIAGYDKLVTPQDCIKTAQYLGRLLGWYADRGVILSSACHGWLPNGVVPMYMNMATQIIESLVTTGQGGRAIIPLTNMQGNFAQDLSDIRASEILFPKYFKKLGRGDAFIPGIIGNQSSLFPFPQDRGMAYAYINYTAMVAAVAGLPACSVKTVDESSGVPSIESHLETYRSANWIFEVCRQQNWEVNAAEVELETSMTVAAVSAIVDKVLELGDGDICVGTVKAIDAGVLDSPFSINKHPRDLCLGARDLHGACRYLEFGNIPLPEEVKQYHREKLRERELVQGVKLGFSASIADFWSLSRGTLTGVAEKSPWEDEAVSWKEAIKEASPTVITGTVGVDSHVIGTKIVSKVLKEYGFNVVALGAQTAPEDFIKAAVETDAAAMCVSSLYGMAEMDCLGFRSKCVEAGLDGILLYIGGILGVGKHDFADDEKRFKSPDIGFDRVFPPETDVERTIVEMCADLAAKGIIKKP